MSAPDAYTLHLLGLAVNEAHRRGHYVWLTFDDPVAFTRVNAYDPEQIAGMLTEMGVEVPERPSAERVAPPEAP